MVKPHAEFSFNNYVNRSTGCTPFELVYGSHPNTPVDINSLPLPPRPSEAALDFSSYMQQLHDECKQRLTFSANSYAAATNSHRRDRQFNEGDMVLVRLKPERFPPGSFTKIHARRAGPFKVIKKMGRNAYVIELPSDFMISPVFNIEDLTAFKGELPSSTNPEAAPVMSLPEQTAPRDEIASIIDHQFVSTRRGGYYKFLVQWKNRPNSESVWLQALSLVNMMTYHESGVRGSSTLKGNQHKNNSHSSDHRMSKEASSLHENGDLGNSYAAYSGDSGRRGSRICQKKKGASTWDQTWSSMSVDKL
ncbi:hypothetical protein SADUNF_Sadunf18G0010400 [Salix dunnii]|uniref:Tf2-1-like SH3-like domain-containing protein n=1 Tax=Salix dunnii TaxID=1413687 RepID=A0A835IZX3_9ROSI|nr:hypothetical protein SADUNF_Sadunf18G0010400 [Salix dunnii]